MTAGERRRHGGELSLSSPVSSSGGAAEHSVTMCDALRGNRFGTRTGDAPDRVPGVSFLPSRGVGTRRPATSGRVRGMDMAQAPVTQQVSQQSVEQVRSTGRTSAPRSSRPPRRRSPRGGSGWTAQQAVRGGRRGTPRPHRPSGRVHELLHRGPAHRRAAHRPRPGGRGHRTVVHLRRRPPGHQPHRCRGRLRRRRPRVPHARPGAGPRTRHRPNPGDPGRRLPRHPRPRRRAARDRRRARVCASSRTRRTRSGPAVAAVPSGPSATSPASASDP